jgi:hypothetical protein
MNKKILGWIFIGIGVVILLTPFTPGSILLLIGMDMVFSDWRKWQQFKEKIKGYIKK